MKHRILRAERLGYPVCLEQLQHGLRRHEMATAVLLNRTHDKKIEVFRVLISHNNHPARHHVAPLYPHVPRENT